MKKFGRITLSIILILSGIAIVVFAISLLLQSKDWVAIVVNLVLLAIGLMIVGSGIRITRGASIREVLGDLFIGLGR